jgi:hypothetical protein
MITRQVICAYCGAPIGDRSELTMEHFVPRGLWDGPRPAGTLTVPVHKQCNKRFSDDDEYFRSVLACWARDGDHPEVLGLLQGAMARCFTAKPGLFQKHFPDLRPRLVTQPSGLYLGRQLTFVLDPERVALAVSKIVRGLFYKAYNRPLPAGYGVCVPVPPPAPSEMAEMTSELSPPASFGDDVFVWRSLRDPEDENTTCWVLIFYRTVCFYAYTLPPGHPLLAGAAAVVWPAQPALAAESSKS